MNITIRNDVSDGLNVQMQGNAGEADLPLVTDGQGRLILSPDLSVDIIADSLDIRDLNSSRDNLTILATGLNIRPMSGIGDSVMMYGRNYGEDTDSGTILALGTRIFLPKDVSMFERNCYEVVNTGGVGVTVTLQIAPVNNDNYYVDDGSSFSLLAGGTRLFIPSKLMRYARIEVSAVLLGSVTVNYFGQS